MKKTPAQIITQVGPKGQLPLNVTQQLMRLLSAHGGKRIKLTIAEVKRAKT